ncbi:MAG: type II secretion system protein, partial [Stackebrandtia sp.]
MIANLAVAMILAAGLGLLVTGLRRPRVDLEASVGRWDARRRDAAAARLTSGRSSGAAGRFARWLRAALNERGIDFTRSASDLALLDRTIEQHLTSKLLAAAAGAAAPALMVGAFRLAGIGAPLLLGGAVSLLLAGLFFFVPDLELRSKATRRRAEMRRALGCYLDLVAMALAGGRGVPEALPQA